MAAQRLGLMLSVNHCAACDHGVEPHQQQYCNFDSILQRSYLPEDVLSVQGIFVSKPHIAMGNALTCTRHRSGAICTFRHSLAPRVNRLCSVHAPTAIDPRNQTLISREYSEETCQPLQAVDEAFY